MKLIKTYICNNFETLAVLSLAVVSSILLLAIRLKITESFFLLFLVWNLFLAAIPYFISSYLQSRKNSSPFLFFSLTALWLLFLPNAPYIVTDLIHLSHNASVSTLFDGIIIATFAISGLLFYLYSFKQMLFLFKNRYSKKIYIAIKFIVPFLTGYGIYLGRFERWNSWNMLNEPLQLINNVIATLTDPLKIVLVIVTTIGFGIILSVLFALFNKRV